jgi:hypothetical protein
MSRKSLRMSNVIRHISAGPLLLFLALIFLVALALISSSYQYGYFNPHVISFIAVALWSVWLISVLWDDIHIKSGRIFRIFRFVFTLFLISAMMVWLVVKNPQLRIFYLLTITILLLVLLVWKMYKSKNERTIA